MSTELTENSMVNTSSVGLTMDVKSMESMLTVAKLMASSKCTIPAHLKNSEADCLAVVMQSMQWGMNPFAVAQKTHLSQGGALGYEAQLISAVITSRGPVVGYPEYEFIGDWDKILGKVEERKSEKGGKYYVATYNASHEIGLGVICRLTLRGESTPREQKVMMSQCYPRFSTQWATDPKQQICYVAIRKWARIHSPGTILGVYSDEELEQVHAAPKDMGQAIPAQPVGVDGEAYEHYEADVLPVLQEAAKSGAEKLKETFQTLSKSMYKARLWEIHGASLKATAASAETPTVIDSETGEVQE